MNSETNTDQPPTLPDTSSWVRRAPGDVIEAGTPYAWRGDASSGVAVSEVSRVVSEVVGTYWTPPPAPSEPWSVISTDREKPTLARVTRDSGPNVIDDWYVTDHFVESEKYQLIKSDVRTVELLHTHNPETHVPVERALIDEAARFATNWDTGESNGTGRVVGFVRRLASLASDESSASDGGRS